MSSIRNRLFFVIAAMAVLASLSIGVGYAVTESARLAVRSDGSDLRDLYDLTAGLATAIGDQEAGIDDYLLSGHADAVARYRGAVEDELRLTEHMKVELTRHPDIVAQLTTVSVAAASWRNSFADPAIDAVARGSKPDIDRIVATAGSDQEPTRTGLHALVALLGDAQAQVALQEDSLTRTRAFAGGVGIALMLLAAGASLILARRWVTMPLDRLMATATRVESGEGVAFTAERPDEIGRLGQALERMRATLQRDTDRSSILNRFTEVTTFAPDDTAVADANLQALDLLVKPDAAVVHVLNRSKDRAVPEATLGSPIADVLPLHSLSRCPGIVRGGIYVTPDASEALSVHCPIYPVETGTLACVPLAHGETVGAVHLYWARPDAFGLDQRAGVARVAEHAALAIGNRRLLAALQGMATTDARTGLANTRAFDQALEDALGERRDGETIGVLMLDLDNFKDFNDRYGHPGGDEALRVFAEVLRSCLRDGDLAGRYGGEEFAVLLPGVDEATVLAVAERIRSRTESTLISLAPGITDRISVSIGVACAPDHAQDRLSLMRRSDEALYRAKETGRNRVVYAGTPPSPEAAAESVAS